MPNCWIAIALSGSYYHLPKEAIKPPNSAGAGKLPARGSGGHPAFLKKIIFSKRGNIFTMEFLSFFQQIERLFQRIVTWDDQAMSTLTDDTRAAVLPWCWFSEGLKQALHLMRVKNATDFGRTEYAFGDKCVTACLDELSNFPWGCSYRLISPLERGLKQLGHRGSETQSKVGPSYLLKSSPNHGPCFDGIELFIRITK